MLDSKAPLRIGFYTYDGNFQAVPACVRAVLRAKAALEAQGHTVSYLPYKLFAVFVFYYIHFLNPKRKMPDHKTNGIKHNWNKNLFWLLPYPHILFCDMAVLIHAKVIMQFMLKSIYNNVSRKFASYCCTIHFLELNASCICIHSTKRLGCRMQLKVTTIGVDLIYLVLTNSIKPKKQKTIIRKRKSRAVNPKIFFV